MSLLSHLLAFTALYAIGKRVIQNRLVLWITLLAIFFDPFYLRWFWAGWEVSPKIAAAAWGLLML
ncbi:hypothetical protein ACFLZE_01710, partial [Thermodesulfobacteriota bacterium]